MFRKFSCRDYFIFTLLFCMFTVQVFAQSLPQRFSIPSWVRMGMSKANIENNLSVDWLFPEMGDYWSRGSTVEPNDWYNFGIDDKKGLIRFRIRAKFDAKTLSDNLIRLYGNPTQRDSENSVWKLRQGQLQNVTAIRVFNNAANENYNVEITYYFSNDNSDGVESDILMDTLVRGYYALNRGEYDIAIRELSNVLTKIPRHDAAYNLRGQAYMGKGDIDRAISDFNQAIQISPNRKNFHGNRADAYRRKENYTAAIADYNAEIRIQPDNYYAYTGRGLVYMDQDKIDLAIADLKKACDSSETFCQFYPSFGYFLGDLYHTHKKNYQEAIKYYTLSLKMFDPEWDSTRNTLGISDNIGLLLYAARARSYAGLERYDLALADLNKVLNTRNLDEMHYDSYRTRGVILYTQKKYNEAISDFTNYLKTKTLSDVDKCSVYHLRATSYMQINNLNAALNDFNELLKLPHGQKEYPEDYFLRGIILYNNKKFEDSISDFDNYLKIKNLSKEQKIEGYRYRAKAYLNLEDFFSALEDFYEIYNLNPKDEEAIKGIAAISAELGITP